MQTVSEKAFEIVFRCSLVRTVVRGAAEVAAVGRAVSVRYNCRDRGASHGHAFLFARHFCGCAFAIGFVDTTHVIEVFVHLEMPRPHRFTSSPAGICFCTAKWSVRRSTIGCGRGRNDDGE